MKIDTKNKLLLLGLAILLFASYKLAIEKTLLLRKEYLLLENQVENAENLPKKIAALEQKESYYDSIIAKMDTGISVQNDLLKTINQEAAKNNTNVLDFNPPHRYQTGDVELNTFSFNVRGAYTDILKVIHTVEQKGSFGEVVHVDFKKKKNHRTNTYRLEATVFIQQVK